ncbi:hypothetical protein ACUUL3_10190 [Thiovibrio sp. JS02]
MVLPQRIVRALTAGVLGGLANSLAIWAFGVLGVTPALGFNYVPELTLAWLMPRLVPSAVWGLMFLPPFWQEDLLEKGLLLSLPLWLVMLLVVFPQKMQAGMFGFGLGWGAPVWAFFFTGLWGLMAALFLKYGWREQ